MRVVRGRLVALRFPGEGGKRGDQRGKHVRQVDGGADDAVATRMLHIQAQPAVAPHQEADQEEVLAILCQAASTMALIPRFCAE
ncbi:hypothetical protein ACGFSD_31425 [Streptomyces caniferus]|uniref:hypothetical protein n=1 Tax=Streptomyces caniferus TaxID=285557 RepID=UPI00371CF403